MGKHKVVVGLGFGDEGKGTIVDYLTATEEVDFVLRFSGGPQAAHNVVTADGRHHTFSQFGSGSFNDIPTILTKYMMINPIYMGNEADALSEKLGYDAMNTMTISENCLLITPWHVAINQIEELRRGKDAHGSCGQGVGVAQKFALDYPDLALRAKDMLLDRDSFVAKATLVRELLKAEYGQPEKEIFGQMNGYVRMDFVRTPGNVHALFEFFMKDYMPIIVSDEEILNLVREFNCVWEGSQGVLLDEWKGFHPYTTWSTTTSQNALQLLSEAGVPREDVEVVGVTRTYHTRHGAGPFPTEDASLLPELPEAHNAEGKFQGGWRVGALDLSLLYYSIEADGEIDSLAVTHLDLDKYYVSDKEHLKPITALSGDLEDQARLTRYLQGLDTPFRWEFSDFGPILQFIVAELQIPISVMSLGPRTDQKLSGTVGVNWYLVDTAAESVVE